MRAARAARACRHSTVSSSGRLGGSWVTGIRLQLSSSAILSAVESRGGGGGGAAGSSSETSECSGSGHMAHIDYLERH